MLTFLKSAGLLLGKIIGVVSGAAPNVLTLLAQYREDYALKADKVIDTFTAILQKAIDVEAAFSAVYPGAKTGPQKLQALTALIVPIIAEIETIKGKPIANAILYREALNDIANGAAKLLNAIEGGQSL
jgi:hypothetical protein